MRHILGNVLLMSTSLIFTAWSRPCFDHEGCGSSILCRRADKPFQPTAIQRRPYDVLRYALLLDWRRPLTDSSQSARGYHGIQRIELRCDTTQLDVIELDASSTLIIDSVSIQRSTNSASEHPQIARNGNLLWLRLGSPVQGGDTITAIIHYRKSSTDAQRQEFYGGYNCYWRDEQDSELPAPLAYTMSQPNNARRWMPCNDRPSDKAQATVTILVPDGFTPLSNGQALPDTVSPHGERISAVTYDSQEPIAPYLMVAIASRFATMEQSYRSSDSLRAIPLRLYLWHSDSLAYADNAQWMLNATAAMMRSFEHYYVPYPFQSYSQVLLYPYFKGAMEHQTMTTLHRDALVQRWETVIAHELAHHWLGDLVTCATWNDLWLNEGGATYSERLWIEDTYGDSAARRYFAARRDRDYLRRDGARSQPPIYNTSGTNLFNTGTTYVKAAWVYHMMRTMLGDSAFFSFLRSYFKHYAYKSLTTEELRDFCEQHIPTPAVPWATFFNQWVYATGHPVFHADLVLLEQRGSTYRVRLRIAQEQDSSVFLPVYIVPLPLRFRHYWSAGTFDTTLIITARQQMVTLDIPFLPRTVELDPDDTILCEKDSSSLVLSVEAPADGESVRILPHPARRGEQIHVWLPDSYRTASVRLWSCNGRLMFQGIAHDELFQLESAQLLPGLYILELMRHGSINRQSIIILP
jgi:aminopeptidase N